MATERERAEIAEAKGAVGRVRAWRWAEPEDPQGFEAPPPEPEPVVELSTKMTQYLVRDVMEQVGGEAMGLHAARRESEVDLKSNGRRVLLALCKLVLLVDVLLQLVMTATVAKGAPDRNTTAPIEPPAYVAVPPMEDIAWDADPPRYRPYTAIPEYAASGHDILELGLLECAPASRYQRWGVDDGTGAWIAGANVSQAQNMEARVGLLFLLDTLSVAGSPTSSGSHATAVCLGCGREPSPCKSSKLGTEITPEPRQCDLRWPPAFADQGMDAAEPDSLAWRVQLPPWGSDLAIRSFLPGTWQSRCIGSSGITNSSDVRSVLCGADGVITHAALTKRGGPDTSLRLNSPRCPRMSCPAQWHAGQTSAPPHQQWKWEALPEDADTGAPNLIRNGGFEAPDVSFNDRLVSAADGVVASWHVFGATQPDESGAYLGNQWATPYGKQSFQLRADCSSKALGHGIKQQFQAEAGAMYSLEFAASGNSKCKACDVGEVTVHDKATGTQLLATNFTGGGKLERSTSDVVGVGTPNIGAAAWSRWAYNFTVPRHIGGALVLSFVAVDCVQIDDVRVVGILATRAAASRPSSALRARWLRERRGLLRQRFVDWATGEESDGLCLGFRPKFPRKMQRVVFQRAGYNNAVLWAALVLLLLPHVIQAVFLRRSAMRMCHAGLMPAWMQYAFPFDKLEGLGFAMRVVPTAEAEDAPAPASPHSSEPTSTKLPDCCFSASARRRLRAACWRAQLFVRFNVFCILVGPVVLIALDASLVYLYLKNHRGSTRAAIASASYQRAQQFVVAHDRLRLFLQAGCIGVPQVMFQLYLWAAVPRFTDTISTQLREFSFAFSMLSFLLVVLHVKLESISHGAGGNTKQHAEELMKVTLGVLPKLAEIRSGQCTVARYDGLEVSPAQVQELASTLRSTHCGLTSLSLAKCNIGDDGIVTLGVVLRDNASLTHLDLRENDITRRGKVLLENALDAADRAHQKKGRGASDHMKVQYLDNDTGAEDTIEAVTDEPSIFVGVRYLAFDEWAIHPPPSLQVDELADVAPTTNATDVLPAALTDEPNAIAQESELHASGTKHAKRVVVGLAHAQFAASVSDELDVDFSHSKIGPEDAPLLARCLSRGCSLRLCTLNLSHNPLGGRRAKLVDVNGIASGATSKQGRHAGAGFVDMGAADAMYEADVTGVVALASVVRCCTALTSLDLAAAQLCGSPDCGSPLTEGIVAIAEAMAGARKLALVDLSGNNITAWNGLYGMDSRSDTAGIDAVLKALDANASLGLVVMRRNKIGFATQTKLRERYRLSGRLQI